jgi:hypothetical protein
MVTGSLYQLPIADCGLPIAACPLWIAECGLEAALKSAISHRKPTEHQQFRNP